MSPRVRWRSRGARTGSRKDHAAENNIRYRCVCIASGANVNSNRLRVVSDLADLGDRRERSCL